MKGKMTRREDYLKMIYTLSDKGAVRGSDLADALEISRPTVCVYLKRLAEAGDVVMDEHRCVHLTEQGLKLAESTLDKHGMIRTLLQELGVPENIAEVDASVLACNVSSETFCVMKQLLSERQNGDERSNR